MVPRALARNLSLTLAMSHVIVLLGTKERHDDVEPQICQPSKTSRIFTAGGLRTTEL